MEDRNGFEAVGAAPRGRDVPEKRAVSRTSAGCDAAPRCGDAGARVASDQSGRTSFRQAQVTRPRQQRLGGRDRQDTARHRGGRQERARTRGYIESRGKKDHGAAGIIVASWRRGRMRVIHAGVGACVDPRVGGRAGGEDVEREHQQHPGSGE